MVLGTGAASRVRMGPHGRSGPCRDYVLAAVKELRRLGIRAVDLTVLAEQLKGIHQSKPS